VIIRSWDGQLKGLITLFPAVGTAHMVSENLLTLQSSHEPGICPFLLKQISRTKGRIHNISSKLKYIL
jgi:hypothetical protein